MRLWFLLGLLLAACASQPAPRPDPRAAQAESALGALASQGFAGSVLVSCGDRVVFQHDYGVRDPAGRAPSYWVASISKQFAATALLQLAEQGKVSLGDPLSRFFPDAPPDKAAVTLTQVMTHYSGLPQAYAADGVTDRDAAARAILATPLVSAPGAAFHYSNDNYSLVAMVVEIVSGEPYDNYLRAHVFEPAHLRDAGVWPSAGDDFVPPVLRVPENARANWGFRGATGVRVSVADLQAWVSALDHGAVLALRSVALLYGPHVRAGDGDDVGFGWFWTDAPNGRWLWTRGSEDFGANTIVYRLAGTPLTLIAATNAGPAEADGPGWSRRARDALMGIYNAGACASH